MSATKSNPAKPVGLLFLMFATVLARVYEHKEKTNMRSIAGLSAVARTVGFEPVAALFYYYLSFA